MIKVGYLISYDYELVLISLKYVYDYSDKIYLAIDKERKTWSGNKFHIPDSFFSELKTIDKKNKIEIYEDFFFIASNLPMQNETRERNMLANRMGKGWCVQLDADEYIYDFNSVTIFLRNNSYLLKNAKATPILFEGVLITLFKILNDGILYVENNEKISFATNVKKFTTARSNINVKPTTTNIKVIHQSWARSNEEVLLKIQNWGHRDDFDTTKFYEFWLKLNSSNYKEYQNFHPLVPIFWNQLKFIPTKNIENFIEVYSKQNPQKINNISIGKKLRFKWKAYFVKAEPLQ